MTENLRRLAVGFLLAFALVALALGYWSVARGQALLAREDNPRIVLAEQQIRRGEILAYDGTMLAAGLAGERYYPQPAFAPVVGYYSIRYGGDGIEAAYDDTLRGDAFLTAAEQEMNRLLHREQTGGDVRLTIDPAVQMASMQALDGRTGAIVVVSVPEGDVLALASTPSYDPNQIDADWDALVEEASAPLLNRATQGLYQPGAAFQVILLSAAYNAQSATMSEPWPGDPTMPVGATRLPCAGEPGEIVQAVDAFVWGCPAPFTVLAEAIGAHRLEETLLDFGLLEEEPFDLPTQHTDGPITLDEATLDDAAIGQGDLLVSPLQMVRIAAALANNGVMPPLRLVEAVRPPGGEWQDAAAEGHSRAIISRDSAEAIAADMSECVDSGAAQAAGLPHEEVHGHVGLAVAGPGGALNAWFTGFTDDVAIVVLLEDEPSAESAAQMGGQLLAEVDQSP
jgi:peptidoglycan glycosyltransferase